MDRQRESIAPNGLCIISDQYFTDYPNSSHMDNKQERRPYYFAIRSDNGIVWLVPISSKVEKYRQKIAAQENLHKDCIFCHIARIKGEERAFLTGNVIPVTENYIKKPFTISGIAYVMRNDAQTKEIIRKTRRYIALVRIGKLKSAVDIMEIERRLLEHLSSNAPDPK